MSGFVHAIMVLDKKRRWVMLSYLSSFVRYKLPRNSQKGVFWLEEEKQKEVKPGGEGKI